MPEEKPQQPAGQPTNADPKQQANPREVHKGGHEGQDKGSVPYVTKDMKPGREK